MPIALVQGKRGTGFDVRTYKETCKDYMIIYLNFIISSGGSTEKQRDSARAILDFIKGDS